MKLSLVILVLCSLSSLGNAHNVLGGVYAIGNDVEGEIGFSNGKMAPEGSVVLVKDKNGSMLASVKTDVDGFFSFVATKRVDHHFFANLGAGHVFEYVLLAEELPDETVGGQHVDPIVADRPTSSLPQSNKLMLQTVVEKAVAKQIKPLRKELNAYKEQASFRDALGGIGYIFGLCGIGIWLTQRKPNDTNKA